MIDILKQHPKDLINRYIVGFTIRSTYTSEQVKEFNENFVVNMFDENDKPILEMDWEYFFFEAGTPEIQYLIANLHNKYSPKPESQAPEIVNAQGDAITSKIIAAQEQDEINKHKSFNQDKQDDIRN